MLPSPTLSRCSFLCCFFVLSCTAGAGGERGEEDDDPHGTSTTMLLPKSNRKGCDAGGVKCAVRTDKATVAGLLMT